MEPEWRVPELPAHQTLLLWYVPSSHHLEKEKPKSWLKLVSAFANISGGHIYFGFTDDTHLAVSLDDVQATASKISELITSRISPNVRFELTEIESDTKEKSCLDLFVSNGPNYPYYYMHERTQEVYVRHGDRSVFATTAELNNLISSYLQKNVCSGSGDVVQYNQWCEL